MNHAIRWVATAAVTAALTVITGPGLAAEPSPAQQQIAERAFAEGNELFDAGSYSAAAEKFRESYAAMASPNSRIMLAQALVKAGKYVEAYREFSGTIADIEESADPRYDQTKAAAREGLDAVRPEVGLLQVRIEGAAERAHVQVGSQLYSVEELDEPIAVAPGRVTISVSAPQGGEARTEASVQAGQSETVEIDLRKKEPPEPAAAPPPAPADPEPEAPPAAPQDDAAPIAPEESRMTPRMETGADEQRDDGGLPLRTMAYTAGLFGVGGFVTFAVAGSMSKSQFDQLESACGDSPCPERQDDIDRGKLQQTVANVGFGVGLVGLAAGTSFFVLSLDDDEDHAAATPPRLVVSPTSVSVRGTF